MQPFKPKSRKAIESVTVKNKFQIVIPQHVREQVHVEIGDILEAGVENGKIIFTLKNLVDRNVAEGLEDVKERPNSRGRTALRKGQLLHWISGSNVMRKIAKHEAAVYQGNAGLSLILQGGG